MQLPDAAPMAVWPPLLAAAGPGDRTAVHRHHALHVVLPTEGTIVATVGGDAVECEGVITGRDVEHAIDATGRQVVLLFVEPESLPGASLTASLDGDATFLDAATRDAVLDGLSVSPGRSELAAWADRAVGMLTHDSWQRPRMHPAVRRLLRVLEELPPDGDASLEALAEQAGLSPSRLMHVFTESVGIPLRPYLRWLRFQRAASAIVAGRPLSIAAAEAGFSDAAHLTRTCKQMFGLTPSMLQRRSQDG